jgi:hypothetical protein
MTNLNAGAELPAEVASGVPEPDSRSWLEQLTKDALAALRKLDANEAEYVDLALDFGALVAKAKETLPHGAYSRWCRTTLKRSPSWCSAYRQIYELREDLEPAAAWASATEHKWAHCRSVERRLKLVKEYRKSTRGSSDNPLRSRKARDGIATLEKRLTGCEAILVAMLDAVAPFWVPRAHNLADAEGDPRKPLAELALRIRARASDPAQTCSALQLSPVEAVGPQLRPEGADDVEHDQELREVLQ